MIREIENEKCKICGVEITQEISEETNGKCAICEWKHNSKKDKKNEIQKTD